MLLCAAILAGLSLLASMTAQTQGSDIQVQKRSGREIKEKLDKENADLPVANYEDEQQAERAITSRRYNMASAGVLDENTQRLPLISHWWWGMQAFPTDQSDAVVIGTIADAQAYISEDKTNVYSEFRVKIERVLSSARTLILTERESLIAQRAGGAVRFRSGRIRYYRINMQNMPRRGHRYLLFLKFNEADGNFSLLTGYELQNGEASPLDDVEVFSNYENYPENELLELVRVAIVNPSLRPR
jgi:hypothetical protein